MVQFLRVMTWSVMGLSCTIVCSCIASLPYRGIPCVLVHWLYILISALYCLFLYNCVAYSAKLSALAYEAYPGLCPHDMAHSLEASDKAYFEEYLRQGYSGGFKSFSSINNTIV